MTVRQPVRLLVPIGRKAATSGLSIRLAGRTWGVTDVLVAGNEPGQIQYVCVSYAHGEVRGAHPFDDREHMSARAIPVIETALAIATVEALWVDAFSVPFDRAERAACLRRMGGIYAGASMVIVVLGGECREVLVQAKQERIDPSLLAAVERDIWVSRAWTFQELANGAAVEFVAEGFPDSRVTLNDLLNAVGKTISELKKTGEVDAFGMRNAYPHLNAFEDLMGGWMAGLADGNAYNTLSCMFGRESTRPEDAFNAIIGAISPDWEDREIDEGVVAAERFMRVCEAKPDFSFIFAGAERSAQPGRSWRPVATDRLDAVLPWHCQGPPLRGTLRDDGLDLEQMWHADAGALTTELMADIQAVLGLPVVGTTVEALAPAIFRELKKGGFSGKGAFVELSAGLFFSRETMLEQSDLVVAVANGLKLAFGGPALLLRPADAYGRHQVVDVGVFVGAVGKEGEKLRLI
jgi:hypothetical protein